MKLVLKTTVEAVPSVGYPHMLVLAVLDPLVVEQVAVASVELAPGARCGNK